MPRSGVGALARVLATSMSLAGASVLGAQSVEVDGHVHARWLDPLRPGMAPSVHYVLTDSSGRQFRLDLSAAQRTAVDQATAAGAARFRVRATPAGEGLQVQSTTVVSTMPPDAGVRRTQDITASAAGTSRRAVPTVTILCKFSDFPTEEPRGATGFESVVSAPRYPSAAFYWGSVTNGYLDFTGSTITRWYTLPNPMEHYFTRNADGTLNLTGDFRFEFLQNDCLRAADADVDFRAFDVINLQYNRVFFVAVGGRPVLTLDGVTRAWGVTFMPAQASPHVYAHEMGHGIGLPHSSTPYEESYGSFWDVMSQGRFHDPIVNEEVSSGTIADQHVRLGSITPAEIVTPADGARETVTMAALNAPGSGPRMLRLPLPDGRWYTVESRLKTGQYERFAPLSGVLLHTVDPAGIPGRDYVPARVIDVDNNRDPNDAGAVRRLGQTWTDAENGYSVTVLSESAAGHVVSVRRGRAATISVRGTGVVAANAFRCERGNCETVVPVAGGTVNLTATPAAGLEFLGWSGGCAGTVASCTLPLTRDTFVVARFGRPIVVRTQSLVEAVRGRSWTDTLRADGGIDRIVWSLEAAPPGITLDGLTGVLSGTPSTAGQSTVIVRARSDILQTPAELSLVVAEPLAAVAGARPPGLVAVPFADTLRATGGSTPATWSVIGGQLPAGVTLAPNGVLTGTPTTSGLATARLAAVSGSQRVELAASWDIIAGFAIAGDSVRARGTMGTAYGDSLATPRGLPGVRFRVTAGGLPGGLRLVDSTGAITGIPEATGRFTFTVEATTTLAAQRTTRSFAIDVIAPEVTAAALLAHVTGGTPLDGDRLRYLDLLGNRNGRVDVGDIAAWVTATRPSPSVAAALLGAASASTARVPADTPAASARPATPPDAGRTSLPQD